MKKAVKKAAEKNGVTVKVGAKVATLKTGEGMTNGVREILAEVSGLCNEVWEGNKKVDSTFFSTKFDAQRLKIACDNGKAGEVMNQLLVFTHNDPSSAGLIARLKTAIAAQGHTATAGTGDGQVKADPRPNTENAGQQPDPVSKTGPVPEQHLDGNVEDPSGGKQMDNRDKQCDNGNDPKADDPKPGDKETGMVHGDGPQSVETAAGAQPIHGEDVPSAAKPAGGKAKRVVKPTDDRGMKTPALSGEAPSAPSADTSHNADKAAPTNTPTAQGGNGAIKDHTDGNQPTAHEGQALYLPEPAAIPGVEMIDMDSIETDEEAASMFERTPAVVAAVRESIGKDGFHAYRPAEVWDLGNGRYKPFNGNTRISIAREYDIKSIPVVKHSFSSRQEFLEAGFEAQLNQRNLSIRDKFAVVKHYYPIEAGKARKRHGGQSAKNPADSKGRADEIIGARIGCSAETVSKMRFIIEAGNKELLDKVYSDDLSISSAFTTLKPKKEKLPDEDKSEISKNKPVPEHKNPVVADEAADANEGAKSPKAQEANPPHSIPAAVIPAPAAIPASIAKEAADAKPDVKAAETAMVQTNQTAPPTPTPPAVPGATTVGISPAIEKLLIGLVNLAREGSKQNIYGLLTGCPQEIRDLIRKHLGGAADPKKRTPQRRTNPVNKVVFQMSGKGNLKKGGSASGKTGKHKSGAGK